jgi:hypothetical protein
MQIIILASLCSATKLGGAQAVIDVIAPLYVLRTLQSSAFLP